MHTIAVVSNVAFPMMVVSHLPLVKSAVHNVYHLHNPGSKITFLNVTPNKAKQVLKTLIWYGTFLLLVVFFTKENALCQPA